MPSYYKLEELSNEHGRLKVSGNLRIEHAAEAREQLLAALERLPSLVVDLSGVETADISFVQLMCAAHREAFARGQEIRVDSDLPDCIREAMERACYHNRFGCIPEAVGSCVWQKHNQYSEGE